MNRNFIFCFFLFVSSTHIHAHEVQASNVDVTVSSDRIEILQTTPLKVAKLIAQKLGAQDQAHATTTNAIAQAWQIKAEKEACYLKKQAYRLAHHESQLQMRYLFACSNEPNTVSLPWFNLSPEGHFIIMNLSKNGKTNTTIFQRQALVIDLL